MTIDLNTLEADILKFAIRTSAPGFSHCPGPDRTIEAVYVHSSCNGGINWSPMADIPMSNRDRSLLMTLPLTASARGVSCRFKIWQPYHSGSGKDVWSVDDLYVGLNQTNSLVFNSATPDSNAFIGKLIFEPHCQRGSALLLQAVSNEETTLALETFPLQVDSFSMIQLEASVGCGHSNSHNRVALQFSTDGGATWTLLATYDDHWIEYDADATSWKRVTLKLPAESWSKATRFRVVQTDHSSDHDQVAIDYFYAGPECPELCRAHGRCSLDGCRCDDGFHQVNCLPVSAALPSTRLPANESLVVKGGRLGGAQMGPCFVPGATNYYFDSAGVRVLETREIQFAPRVAVHFLLRLGYCERELVGGDSVQVSLQLSSNGGQTWSTLQEYRSPFFASPQFDRIVVPLVSDIDDGSSQYFKVRLVQNGLHNRYEDVWSVAGFGISSPSTVFTRAELHQMDRPLEDNAHLWIVANEADPQSSCPVNRGVPCRSKIEWYGAMTREVSLNPGDVIQFEISAKKTRELDDARSENRQDRLSVEYSADGGATWNLILRPCSAAWLNCQQWQQPSIIDYRTLRQNGGGKFVYFVTENMANRLGGRDKFLCLFLIILL